MPMMPRSRGPQDPARDRIVYSYSLSPFVIRSEGSRAPERWKEQIASPRSVLRAQDGAERVAHRNRSGGEVQVPRSGTGFGPVRSIRGNPIAFAQFG